MEDYEKDALFGLLVKIFTSVKERNDAEAAVRKAQEEQTAAFATFEKLRLATSSFGIDPNSPDFFSDISKVLGEKRFIDAQERSNFRARGDGSADVEEAIALLPHVSADGEDKKIRELVLENLKNAGTSGIRSSEVKQALVSLGIEMHDKTVGMTLYRLSQTDEAVRRGRIWFARKFAPPRS